MENPMTMKYDKLDNVLEDIDLLSVNVINLYTTVLSIYEYLKGEKAPELVLPDEASSGFFETVETLIMKLDKTTTATRMLLEKMCAND